MTVGVLEKDLPKDRLRSLRAWRRIESSDVATAAAISVDELHKIEAGEAKPRVSTLRKLAEIYAIPVSSFYVAGSKDLDAPLPDFRTLKNKPVKYSPHLVKSIAWADEIAKFTKYISLSLDDKAPQQPPKIERGRDVAETSKELERLLQFGANYRAAKLKPNQLLRHFRKSLGDLGVVVLFDSFKDETSRGFCFIDEVRFPTIVVNTRNQGTPQARLFTLIHEACHVLMGREGIVDPYSSNEVERLCNSISAEFLAPREQFIHVARNELAIHKTISAAVLKRIASQFGLSQQATAVRLEALGLVTKGFYDEWMKQYENKPLPDELKLGGGSERPEEGVIKLAKYGHLFVLKCEAAIEKKIIDEFDVFQVSHLKPQYFAQTVKAAKEFLAEVAGYGQQ